MHPRLEIFATLAVVAGGVAGWGSATNEAIGGIEGTSAGAATLAITNVPTSAACLRVTVAGSRTDVRLFSVAPGMDAAFELGALPAGRDTLSAETFSVACAGVADGATSNGHSEPTVALISVGDTARVDLVMIRDAETRVAARLAARLRR